MRGLLAVVLCLHGPAAMVALSQPWYEDSSERRSALVNAGRVLILDDNDAVRVSVSVFLEDAGFETRVAASISEAHKALDTDSFDAAIVDYMLPDGTALELLQRLRESGSSMPVIVLTGHGSIDLAVRTIQAGAEQFLTKPLQLPTLLEVLKRTTDGRRTQRRELATRSKTRRDVLDPFAGISDAMKRLADEARRVVATDKPVLVLGETGSGKGVLAAWLHSHSPRAGDALVDINCAGLTSQLLESELFGHERGAFTGAHAAKTGLIEVAHRGTLFLDEMGDLDLAVQPKLLKVLEEKRFRRLGSVRDRVVDIRLVAATHVDLAQAVAERRFRGDLYFRINTLVLNVPPLRERPEDIAPIARHMLDTLRNEPVELSTDAMRAMTAYRWPGNVRELRNVLERAVLLTDKRVITAAELRLNGAMPMGERDAGSFEVVSLEENERRYLVRLLEAKGGRVDECARALGVPLSSLYQRLKRLGIGRGRA